MFSFSATVVDTALTQAVFFFDRQFMIVAGCKYHSEQCFTGTYVRVISEKSLL